MKVESIQSTGAVRDIGAGINRSSRQVATSGSAQTTAEPIEFIDEPILQQRVQSQSSEEQKFMPSERSQVNDDIMQKALEKANSELGKVDRKIELSVHPKTHTIMYKVCDSVTGEVISEFPPEKIQDMIAKIWELAGLFVDEKL